MASSINYRTEFDAPQHKKKKKSTEMPQLNLHHGKTAACSGGSDETRGGGRGGLQSQTNDGAQNRASMFDDGRRGGDGAGWRDKTKMKRSRAGRARTQMERRD